MRLRPQDWSVAEVQRWLQRNGFDRYAVAFALEDVNGAELVQMTKTGLMLLGVADPDLLRAIQLLRRETPLQLPMSDAKLNLLIKDLEKTIAWLIRRIGNLYDLAPSTIFRLHRDITTFRSGEDCASFMERFVTADTIDSLEKSMAAPSSTSPKEKNTTSLAELTKTAANVVRSEKIPILSRAKKAIDDRKIADQSRFDIQLKSIRRNNRIILPAKLRSRQGADDDSASLESAAKTMAADGLFVDDRKPSKYLLLPTDPIRARFDLVMM